VEIGAGSAGFDLGVDHAAQADAEGGKLGGEHLCVGNEGDVGFELVAVLADEGGDAFAADLFLAFEDDADVDGEFAVVCGEEALEGFDVHPHLALVVNGSAGVEVFVALGGLEGWGEPLVEGFGGLDVVVAVAEDGRGAGSVEVVGVDERVAVGVGCARGFDEVDVVEADAGELGGAEFGSAADVGKVLGGGGDGGDAQEGLELFDELFFVRVGEVYGCV